MTEPQHITKNDDKLTDKSQQRLGKIVKNPFFNFLREMRKNAQGMTMIACAIKGAEIWKNMSQIEKEPYYLMAKQVSSRKSKKSKGRRSRRSDLLTNNNTDRHDELVSQMDKAKRRESRSRSKRKRSRSHSKSRQ